MVRLFIKTAVNNQQTKGHRSIYCGFLLHIQKLIIEIDGSQHGKPDNVEYDRERTVYLEGLGYKVVRYSNDEINHNFDGVCRDVLTHLGIRELFR